MVPYQVRYINGVWEVGTRYHGWHTHSVWLTEKEARAKCDKLNHFKQEEGK